MNPKFYWENTHRKYSQKDWITKPTMFATQVVRFFPKTGKILDLGAGQGQDSVYFTSLGYQVLATDFSKFALSRITDNLVRKQLVDLNQPLPFAPFSFDVVYSHLALHYYDLKRTQNLFDEIFQIIKPGGIFAALTNTIEDPEISEASSIEPGFYLSGGIPKRYFSTKTFADLTPKYETLLLDNQGETYKDEIKTLIRFVGRKPAT